jgi:uncharacterized paraquat-inducible protein A
MTTQILALVLVLLVCLGLLLGATWTIRALQLRLRRQAEEQRRLNEEWLAIRNARWQRGRCPRCAGTLYERHRYFGPAPEEYLTNGD